MVMTTFYQRLKRYAKTRLGCDGAVTYRLLKLLYEELVPEALHHNMEPPAPPPETTSEERKKMQEKRNKWLRRRAAVNALPPDQASLLQELARRFTMTPTDAHLSHHPEAFMKLLHAFQLTAASNGKQFSLLPHTGGFTTKFMKINGNILRRLVLDGLTEEEEAAMAAATAKKRSKAAKAAAAARKAAKEGGPSNAPATAASDGDGGDDGLVPGEAGFLAVQSVWWAKFFYIDKVSTARRKFGNEILTDGKSVKITMTYERPPAPDSPPLPDRDDFDAILGLDPGVRDMFVTTDLNGATMSCSAKEFYHDAKYNLTTKKIRTWTAAAPDITAILESMPSKHDFEPAARRQYGRYVLHHYERLKEFYGALRFRNLKLLRHIHRKKKLRKICQQLTSSAEPGRTLIGFGDWSASSGGCISGRRGPVMKLKKELRKYATVMDVDENYTSKTCNCCKLRSLRNMKCHKHLSAKALARPLRWRLALEDDWDAPRRKRALTQKVHSVLHCSTNGCFSTTVNRDVNASRNILELAMGALRGWPRPKVFCHD
jgi:hypothetical protein